MSCAQAGIVQVRGAAAARPRVRVVGPGRGRVASAPSGEVRGGMELVAASAPGKALPGADSPRPAGGMRWRVVGVRCHCARLRGAAFVPRRSVRDGTPGRARERCPGRGAAVWRGRSPRSSLGPGGLRAEPSACRLNSTSEQIV